MSIFSGKSWFVLFIVVVVSSCAPGKVATTTSKNTFTKGFSESFEDISKGNYSAGYVELSGGDWYFEDALIGSTANDTKNGIKAIRIREAGLVKMNYDLSGVLNIRIAYGAYQGDTDSEWELYVSRNSGAEWLKWGNRIKTQGAQLKVHSISINEPGKLRFEIRKISGGHNRLNIDDIVISTSASSIENSAVATRDDNLGMGNPSMASAKDENNYLIIKPQYILSYSRAHSSANWVSWHLSSAWQGNVNRADNFRPDESLPKDWYRVLSADYVGSGFDRGHLCPSGDRDRSTEDNDATFLLTNIVPQAPNNNRGAWADLEVYCRKVADAGHELYIIAGVHGKAGIGTNGGKSFTLDNGKMIVPESLWKVIVILPVGADDINRINKQTRVIAVNIPNKQTISDTKWSEYRLSVDDLEKITGYDFLSNLPTQIQQSIESDADNGPTIKVSSVRQ